jgi:hypothetical protein
VRKSGGGGSEFLDGDLFFRAVPIFEFVAVFSAARLIQFVGTVADLVFEFEVLGFVCGGRWEYLWGIGIHGGDSLKPNVRPLIAWSQWPKIGAVESVNWHRHGHDEMKHQVVHALQKYVLNPPIKLLFAIGVVPPGYALLETIGRKTGKVRSTPVGDARVGDRLWIVAEHGMKAGYVRNIKENPRVRVKLRKGFGAHWAHWHGAPPLGR